MSASTKRRRLENLTQFEQDFSLRMFTSVLIQWWRVLIPVTLFALLISSVFVFWSFRPQYRASAWLQINGVQPYVAFPDREIGDRDSNRKFVHTQVELLRSPLILGRVLSQPEIAAMQEIRSRRDPIDWLSTQGLLITPKGSSELLEVAFEGVNPENSALLVNAIIDAYFTMRQEKRGQRAQSVISLLEDERARRSEEIKLLQAEVRQLQKQLVANDPSLTSTSLIGSDVVISESPLKSMQENLAKAQIEHKVLAAQVQALEDSVQTGPAVPDVLIEREIAGREEVQRVLVALNQKKALRDQALNASSRGGTDPRIIKLNQDIESLESTLESLRDTNRPRIREEMKAMSGLQRQQELAALKTQLETQKLIVQSMRSNYDAMVEDISQSGGQTLDLKFKQAELNRKQQVFDSISERAAQIATEMYAPSRVELVQKATTPEVPVQTLPWKMLLVTVLASISLPFGLFLIWERTLKRVTSSEQLQVDNNLPVVGEIACLPEKSITHELDDDIDHLGLFEESIDSLRTGLVLSQKNESIQVVVVSSSVAGEGKSSVASQLAVSLARSSGMPTLLIDGDMRSPDIHRIFKVENKPGLVGVLSGECDFEAAVNREWSEHVHVLPAGYLDRSPHKLMANDGFKQLIAKARDSYRYIVVDTPPVLAASESLVMARDADATLVCAMRDVSRENHVRMTYHRLLSVGARPVGTVLNGVPTRQYARRYGTYGYETASSFSADQEEVT